MRRVVVDTWRAVAAVLVLSSTAEAGPSDPDAAFGGGDGIVIENFGAIETGGRIFELSTGKLLLVGNGNGTNTGHSFTRYNTNGTVDGTYGTGGTAAGHFGSVWGATLLPGDELLVASDFDTGSLSELTDAAVMRYTATGAKDAGFGTNGRVTFRLDPDVAAAEHATGVIELASGKLLVCGWLWRGGTNFDIGVVRLDSSGNVDTTFADGGYFLFDWKGGLDKAWQVLELPDKKIIVYGEVSDPAALGSPSRVFFLRLTENGTIDTTFGGAGTGYTSVLTDVNSDAPGGMVRLASGKFLFAIGGTALWTAGRVTAGGVLDSDFGTAGIAKLTPVFPGGIFPVPASIGVAVQSDNRFVIGAWVSAVTPQFQLMYDAGLARFEENGTPDTTFNNGSAQRTYTITNAAPEVATSVIVHSDGGILLGGSYPNGTDDRWLLRVEGDEPVVTTTTLPETLCGDANGDGKINASDALATLRAAVGFVECAPSVCDVTGDGAVKAADALRVLQYAVGGGVTLNCPV